MTNNNRSWPMMVGLTMAIALLFPMTLLAEEISVSGFTEAYHDAILGIAATGQVQKIHRAEGDSIKKGQAILDLEQQAEILEVKRRQLLLETKTEINGVTRQLKTLETHLNATRELYRSTGSVPREELENQELEYALAEIELLRLQQAEQREQIELEIAEQKLQQKTLRAPFSGVIAEIMVEVGENCEFDTKLARLVNTSHGYFVANVELPITQQIKLGQATELIFQTGVDPIKIKATITFISPVVDPASGLRKIKAKFDNRDGKIVPGVAGLMVIDN